MEARTKKSNTRELRIRTSGTGSFLKLTAHAIFEKTSLFHDFVPKFLDDRICEDFPGHALDLFFGGIACHAIQIKHEKLALADVADLAKPERRKGMLYSLALRIEDSALRHHPHMCFHRPNYTKPSAAAPE
jgi:hypothetical protein